MLEMRILIIFSGFPMAYFFPNSYFSFCSGETSGTWNQKRYVMGAVLWAGRTKGLKGTHSWPAFPFYPPSLLWHYFHKSYVMLLVLAAMAWKCRKEDGQERGWMNKVSSDCAFIGGWGHSEGSWDYSSVQRTAP